MAQLQPQLVLIHLFVFILFIYSFIYLFIYLFIFHCKTCEPIRSPESFWGTHSQTHKLTNPLTKPCMEAGTLPKKHMNLAPHSSPLSVPTKYTCSWFTWAEAYWSTFVRLVVSFIVILSKQVLIKLQIGQLGQSCVHFITRNITCPPSLQPNKPCKGASMYMTHGLKMLVNLEKPGVSELNTQGPRLVTTFAKLKVNYNLIINWD